jgi:16S rRNA (guanine527-N7)-methyltransferase
VNGQLPSIPLPEFDDRLRPFAPDLPAPVVVALHGHYGELRRWNASLSLVGLGTAKEIVERHYGESVAALSIVDAAPGGPSGRDLLDVGSGAGFPGLILAICRPTLRVTLLEARGRKAEFLRRSARAAAASVRVVEGFLDRTLPHDVPEKLDFVTLRAVKLGPASWRALRARLAPGGLVLQWSGPESPPPPGGFEQTSELVLATSRQRSIRVWAATAA